MQSVFEKIKERLEESGKEIYREPTVKDPPGCSLIPTGEKDLLVSKAIEIVNQVADNTNMGEISDGYHTFNELYHHRAVLFSVICNSHKKLAWKSKKHDTGDMYDGMFIVGIETPEGQATYHYDIDPYWDMFEVKELPNAPKWDGHTPDESIRRIGLLGNDGWTPCSERLPDYGRRCWITYEWSDGSLHVDNDYLVDGIWFETENEAVKAWMYNDVEIPKPYQPKGE